MRRNATLYCWLSLCGSLMPSWEDYWHFSWLWVSGVARLGNTGAHAPQQCPFVPQQSFVCSLIFGLSGTMKTCTIYKGWSLVYRMCPSNGYKFVGKEGKVHYKPHLKRLWSVILSVVGSVTAYSEAYLCTVLNRGLK